MATLYTFQSQNIRRTWMLFSAFFVVVIALGWVFSYSFNSQAILFYAVIFSVISASISYWSSDKIALALARAGDTVAITGKGAEQWLCQAGGVKLPWDDRTVAREEIVKLASRVVDN